MKKRIFALTLSLLLALSTSACGTQSAEGTGNDQNAPADPAAGNSDQNMPNGSGTGNGSSTNGYGMNTPFGTLTDGSDMNLSGILGIDDSTLSFSSLTDFYNSEFRTLLEETMNEIFSEATGLHMFYTIEEPDTLIYNCQYTNPLSSIGLSHEEAAATIASNLQELGAYDETINDIKFYQSYGIPVKVLQTNYLDADGSPVYSYSVDVTGDTVISVLPDTSGTAAGAYASLQEWADSEEAVSVIETTNRTLTSTGITFDLAVDGNLLIYKYYLPDNSWTSDLTEEELTASFDSMTESLAVSVDAIFTTFTDTYGLTVDAVRFVYYSAGGSELYSKDFMP